MFWTTLYTPKSLHQISSDDTPYFHKQISRKIINYLSEQNNDSIYNHPGICFLGYTSVGKWTMAHLFLEYLFSKGIYVIRKQKLQLDKGDTFEIDASNHHCEFNESIFLNCKSNVFLKVIESLGESQHICDMNKPYYILCKNIHLWTKDYYNIIKHATEKYSDTLRFIITSQQYIKPFNELFTTFRIPTPKKEEILECIEQIFKDKLYDYNNTIQNKIIQKITNSADNDYKSILLWCQEKMVPGTWTNQKKVKKIELKHIVSLLISSQSLESLLQLRDMLIECISFGKIEKLPSYLIKHISKYPTLSNDIKRDCISSIAKFDSRMKLHHRNHIHYEAMLYELFYNIHKNRNMN